MLFRSVRITFEQAVFGVEKELNVTMKETCKVCGGNGCKPGTAPKICPKCGGKGQVVYHSQSLFGTVQQVSACPDCGGTGQFIENKCPGCRGTGYQAERKTISISIPAGIEDGQYYRIRGKGEPGRNGGERGDLMVLVRVSTHPVFKRDGVNIFSEVKIPFTKAALGGKVHIQTLDGDFEQEVKAGTPTGTVVRLRGKGVPNLRSRGTRGDHFVTLTVDVPTSLNAEQREALRAFEETMEGKSPYGERKKKGLFH